jgi:UDP-glucose 4-epimerase
LICPSFSTHPNRQSANKALITTFHPIAFFAYFALILMKSTGLKVLVTGGAGYIGSHTVVELYAAGYVPVILDNFERSNPSVAEAIHAITGQSPTTYQIDCRDAEGLDKVFQAEGGFAAVIHFAAYKAVAESVAFPAKYHDNNIGGLAVVLQAMERNGNPPLVFSSSCTVYGQPEILPVTESSPLLPANSPYGYTKQVCEEMINQAVVGQMQARAVTLRYFNPIGAHPSALLGEQPIGVPNNLVPFITQAAAGLRPPVTIFGNDYPTPMAPISGTISMWLTWPRRMWRLWTSWWGPMAEGSTGFLTWVRAKGIRCLKW